jgi:hypothetical protein
MMMIVIVMGRGGRRRMIMALMMEILDSKQTMKNKCWKERNMSIENVLDTKTKMEHRIVRVIDIYISQRNDCG